MVARSMGCGWEPIACARSSWTWVVAAWPDPAALAALLPPGTAAALEPEIAAGLERALTGGPELVVACGSIFLIGTVRALLEARRARG